MRSSRLDRPHRVHARAWRYSACREHCSGSRRGPVCRGNFLRHRHRCRAGEALIDPASGTPLGTSDTLIGMIVVKAVKPKYSVGEMVSGEKQERNDIVRATNQAANP